MRLNLRALSSVGWQYMTVPRPMIKEPRVKSSARVVFPIWAELINVTMRHGSAGDRVHASRVETQLIQYRCSCIDTPYREAAARVSHQCYRWTIARIASWIDGARCAVHGARCRVVLDIGVEIGTQRSTA